MLGIWLGKLVAIFLRLRGHKATSLPGKLALRVSPQLIKKLGQQLGNCVVITGTNGKTTTTSFLAQMIQQKNPTIITNAEGANLPQGIASVLLQHASWFGHLRAKIAILEVDEATFPLIAASLPIRLTVVTNVFRDQLDRYGEVDTTLQKILAGINQTTGQVLLNADDPLASHIGVHTKNPVSYFGMSKDTSDGVLRNQIRDGAFCLECGAELIYEQFIYGQLGFYKCPHCEFHRPQPQFVGTSVGDRLIINQENQPELQILLPVPGLFNVYNALCAIAAATLYGLEHPYMQQGIATFQAPTGRMQMFHTQPQTILNLIKNPTGCDSVLQTICHDSGPKILCIGIHDLAADGRDISWLWDADFELIADNSHVLYCVTAGYRAEDMALRLKYAGYPSTQVACIPSIHAAIDKAMELSQEIGHIPVYILTTYTLLHATAADLQGRVTAYARPVENSTSLS